jgi:hypothetical protein
MRDDVRVSKRTRILLIALVWLAAAAWCWALAVWPAAGAWMGREAWPLGALTGLMVGRMSRRR